MSISLHSRKLFGRLQRGTRAAQPSAASSSGIFYHVTDENVIERSDGTSWERVTDAITTGTHSLLDAFAHTDTAGQSVSRGSLIYGNSTPAWDELAVGTADQVLRSDGTDISWGRVALAGIAQSSAASRLLGRGSASAGDWQEITLGAGITLSGTEISVTASGAGDVLGPASSTDNAIVRFDGTTGKAIQNSGVTIDDTNNITGVGSFTATSYTNHLGAFAATTSAQLAGVISDETGTGSLVFGTKPTITFANTGLTIRDTGDDHVLTITPGSNLTANRTLTLTTGDAARTITLNGDTTLADWFDQSVKVAASPTFVDITLSGATLTAGATNLYLEGASIRSLALYNDTTASAASLTIDNTNKNLQRSTSSRRYKDEIEDLAIGLEAVRKLRPRSFVGKRDRAGSEGKWKHFGFIAEEVAEVMPNLVGYEQIDGEWVPGWIEYDYMTAPIVSAIQALADENDALRKRVGLLEKSIRGN